MSWKSVLWELNCSMGREMDRHDKANNELVFHICALNDKSVSKMQPTNAHM